MMVFVCIQERLKLSKPGGIGAVNAALNKSLNRERLSVTNLSSEK